MTRPALYANLNEAEATMPITATVQQFAKLSGLGKTSIKKMIQSGQIQSIKSCGRRLIVVESYVALVQQRAEAECRSRMAVTNGRKEGE